MLRFVDRTNVIACDDHKAGPDEDQPEQFADVEDLYDAGTSEPATDSWQDRANRDEDVPENSRRGIALLPVAPRRPDSSSDEEHDRVEVHER